MAWALTDLTTAVDLSALVDVKSLVVTGRAYANISRLSARIRDELSAVTIATEHEILLTDGATKIFAGFVRQLLKEDTGVSGQRIYSIECQDYSTLLADDVADVGASRSTVESDKARITWLFATFGTKGISIGASVQTITASMPAQDFTGLNLHQCLTLIASVTGGSFYVDYNKVLHYFSSEVNAAPFGLSDAPNGTTTFGFEKFSEASDTVDYINAAYGVGTGVSGWRTLGGVAIATLRGAGTLRATTLVDPEITDMTTLNAALDSLIATYGQIRKPSSLTTYKAGLLAGQYVQVTHSGWGISAVSYRIAGVVATPDTKDRIAYSIDFGNAPADLGTLISGQAGGIAAAQGAAQAVSDASISIADLSIGGANLIPNSSFEDGTSWTVGANWAIGYTPVGGLLAFAGTDTARLTLAAQTAGDLVTPKMAVYPGDWYVVSFWHFIRSRTSGTLRMSVREYNAANALLATTNVDLTAVDTTYVREILRFGPAAGLGVIAWQPSTAKVDVVFNSTGAAATLTADVDGVQLERGNAVTAYAPSPQELVTGSIVNADLAANSVATAQLQVDAVTAAIIAAGAVGSGELAAGSVIAGKIGALSITAAEMAAGSITAAKIVAGTITATEIASNAITAIKIAANAIVAGKIAAGVITATEIAANSITSDRLVAGAITLYDEYGSVALTPSGFSGAWVDFIGDGVYDSTFRLATAGAIPNGRGSLLPNWTVSRSSLTSAIFVADAAWPGGGYIEAIPSALFGQLTLVSDLVPIPPGMPVVLTAIAAAISAGGSLPVVFGTVRFYAADATTLLATVSGVNLVTYNLTDTTPGSYGSGPLSPPPGAKFATAEIAITEFTAHSGSTRLRLGGGSLRRAHSAGKQTYAWQLGAGPSLPWGNVVNMPADFAYYIPIQVTSPMEIGAVMFLSSDTTLARKVTWQLYRDDLGSNFLTALTGVGGNLSWTASAKSIQSAPVGSGYLIPPGNYILRFQNSHASNTLGVGYSASITAAAGYGTLPVAYQQSGAGAITTPIDITGASGAAALLGVWLSGWSGGVLWGQ